MFPSQAVGWLGLLLFWVMPRAGVLRFVRLLWVPVGRPAEYQ
jgi:hypothetical protein